MKILATKNILLFFLIFVNQLSAQSKINFIENDFDVAIEQTKLVNKPLFVMVYADWCPHCTKMKNEVFTDLEVIRFLNENFVNLKLNSETKFCKDFMLKFNIKSFPTFLILDSDQNNLYNFNGEFTNKETVIELNKGLNPTTQLPYLEKQFNEDVENPQKCLAYLNGLKNGINKDKTVEIADKYLITKNEEQLLSEINWKILAFSVTELSSKYFSFIVKNKVEFAKLTSKKRVDTKIFNAINKSLKINLKNLDSISYSKNKSILKSVQTSAIDSLLFNFDVQIYSSLKDWKNYKQVTKNAVEKWSWNDYKMLNEISKNYIENITDSESLKLALNWLKRSEEINQSHETDFLIAKLYYKLKNKKQAIEYARKTKAVISKMGWNTKEIDAFGKELGINDF